MKKMHLSSRLLSLLLIVALLFSFAVPVGAANSGSNVSFKQVDNSAVSGSLQEGIPEEEPDGLDYADAEVVRVSIVLDKESTIEAGFSTMDIGKNQEAMSYRAGLQREQANMTASIEKAIGEKLDVAWNLTLAANIISANVAYGKIQQIRELPGVKDVILETRYEPQESTTDATAEPNMLISAQMTGTNRAWESGYTGAGSRIAIIDTGLDTDHQSFDPLSLAVALAEDAGYAGMDYEEYLKALDVLDEEEITEALPKLNASARYSGLTASDLYINLKAPFGFCYIDKDLDVTHDNDNQGEHGSHVAGIASANRYLKRGEEYVSAGDAVGVVGNAPDAQLIVMKVFGNGGGAYDSDYMAAIEDAIILNCDSVNLSLGSSNAGMTTNSTYQSLLDSLVETDTVVCISAGNNGYWAENSQSVAGTLYGDDVNFHTGGSPGTYTNSFTVASVDNDGAIGNCFRVAGKDFVYNETDYTNEPFTSLDTSADGSGTSLDYVFITGVGQAEDYTGIDVAGKVVFCSRGTTSFYEKAEIAVGLGAIATVVCNNQPGVINMDLTDYKQTAPCVSITQANAAYIKEHSTEAVTEGGVTYYTGTLTVDQKLAVSINNSPYYTMSEFSSWGVPGDLSLKPEITAPGGSIYSVNGATKETDQYELMSGTSMAAPQISGITALVKQYIRENQLSQSGITDRALAQSLMMSTAVPMKDEDGNYYPVLQQGAGLANTAAATSADSYILVDGQDDGKVKAELGEDAGRDGVYSFGFTLNNLTSETKVFELSADLFTQDMFAYYANGNQDMSQLANYLDVATTALEANVSWTADGQVVNSAGEMAKCDFDGDGDVDTDDGQALLDYVTGARASISSADFADINHDGRVDTYDVHLFLGKLGKDTVTVPANGSVKLTVTMTLTEEQKAELDRYYTNGAYVEAYVYAHALTNVEGVEGTSHSIPVLAFYGSWTDSSMFDVGTYMEYATGEEFRVPYLGNVNANALGIIYGDEPDSMYYFGGNPLVPDEKYMPERNAVNSERGDKFGKWTFSAIRNAGASRFTVTNVETGEILASAEPGAVSAAYYYSRTASWQQTGYNLNLNWSPAGLKEGDAVELALTLAPELYVQKDGTVNWDALGKGASLKMPAVIDNTAPVLEDVSLSLTGDTMTVTASDNRYLAAAVLYNAGGTMPLAYEGTTADAKPGETRSFVLDLKGVNGKKFLLQVADYAMNVVTYEVNIQIGEPLPAPDMIAFDSSANSWIGFGRNDDLTTAQTLSTSKETFLAATDVDGMIFASTAEGDLYVLNEEDPSEATYVTNLGVILTDMAYNSETGILYGVTDNQLVTVDKLLGTVETVGEIGITTNTLACDNEGNFYCVAYGDTNEVTNRGFVYRFTLDTMAEPVAITSEVHSNNYVQALELNPNNGKLYWNSFYYFDFYGFFQLIYAELYEIDPATGEVVTLKDFEHEITALCIPLKSSGGGWSQPTDEVSAVNLSDTSLSILRGNKAQLSASVLPWTATNRDVTWTSSNEAVATVDASGVVTGLEVGQSVITATSVLDPTVYASCVVTVETVNTTLDGVLQDKDGNPMFFQWNLETDATWTGGAAVDTSLTSATYDPKNNVMYIMDAAENTWAMHKVSMEGKTLENSGANAAGVPLWDQAYSEVFSTDETAMVGSIYYYYFLAPKNPMALDTSAFNLSSRLSTAGAEYLVAITSLGYEEFWDEEDEVMLDTEHFILLDNGGNLWHFWTYATDDGYSAWLSMFASDLALEFPGDDSGNNMYTSMVAGDDGALYLSAFTGETNEIYRLVLDEANEIYNATRLGDVGDSVWPAALYQAKANASNDGNASWNVLTANAENITAELVSEDDLAAAPGKASVNRTAKIGQLRPQAEQTSAGSLNAVLTGSVNKAKANKLPLELLSVGTDTDCTEKTVTLTLTADDVTTNGRITVAYDAAKLTLTDKSGKAQYNSFSEKDGLVTFGYAYKESAPAGTVLATLTFAAAEDTEATFTVTTVEDGANPLGTVENITMTVPEHDYMITVVEATCTEDGYTLYTCRNCGHSYRDNLVEALGHSWGAWTVTKAPDCEHEGVETRICSRCGESETRPVEAVGHTYTVTIVEPTCTEDGYTLYTCEDCGYSYRDNVVKATGHSWGDWAVTKEATCDHDGVETRTCAVCGETETRPVEALGHDWSDWTVTKEPTCEQAGEESRTCAGCGEVETRPVDALGHSYRETVVAPNCTEGGYTLHACEVCGHTYKTDEKKPLGHDWSDWTVTDPADCFHAGSETHTCTRCDATEIRTIPANSDHCPSKGFEDVDLNRWYHKGIDFVVSENLMVGMGNNLFQPNGSLTRGQLATILYRLAGSPETSGKSPFTDVAEGRYYSDTVAWAAENGIVTGITDTLFAPNQPVTREQLVTMIGRYAEKKGIEIVAKGDLNAYPDASNVSNYAKAYMIWAVENGIVNGAGGKLMPKDTASRAQIAAIIMRYCEAFGK